MDITVRPEDIEQIWDGKAWKAVDWVKFAWLSFDDASHKRERVMIADLQGGGNKRTVWRQGNFPPFRIGPP